MDPLVNLFLSTSWKWSLPPVQVNEHTQSVERHRSGSMS